MSAGQIIAAALHAMGGTVGAMCLALERKQAVPKPMILLWVKKLRKAADTLEELLK